MGFTANPGGEKAFKGVPLIGTEAVKGVSRPRCARAASLDRKEREGLASVR